MADPQKAMMRTRAGSSRGAQPQSVIEWLRYGLAKLDESLLLPNAFPRTGPLTGAQRTALWRARRRREGYCARCCQRRTAFGRTQCWLCNDDAKARVRVWRDRKRARAQIAAG
jgi:hypothetical protein